MITTKAQATKKQVSLPETEKLLHSEGNHPQSRKATYGWNGEKMQTICMIRG